MQYFAVDVVHLILFSCLLYLGSTSAAQDYAYGNCNTANNYTSGSVYEQNLNLSLTFLVANSSIQCIGDLSNKDCQTCAYTAATEIRRNCHNQKEASIGFNNCSLQSSDRRFFSTVNSAPIFRAVNVNDATDTLLFKQKLEFLVQKISSDAAASP